MEERRKRLWKEGGREEGREGWRITEGGDGGKGGKAMGGRRKGRELGREGWRREGGGGKGEEAMGGKRKGTGGVWGSSRSKGSYF